MQTSHLNFLLRPIKCLVEVITGENAIYSTENGYYFEVLKVVIDKSCSGFNFLLICFLLLGLSRIDHFQKPFYKLGYVFASLLVSYLVTIITNAFRILTCIGFQTEISNHFIFKETVIHEAIGVTTNFAMLITIYFCIEKITLKILQNEEYT